MTFEGQMRKISKKAPNCILLPMFRARGRVCPARDGAAVPGGPRDGRQGGHGGQQQHQHQNRVQSLQVQRKQ